MSDDLTEIITDPEGSDQLLMLSAETMRQYAHMYCSQNNWSGSESRCEWYHAAWQYCRLMGLIPSPDLHASFYAQLFNNTDNLNVYNILVSGTADYAILDHLIKSIPQNFVQKVSISILDVCRTPLEICKWYAGWYEDNFNIHLNIQYAQGNAFNTHYGNHTFDLITTYSFLSFFQADEQKKLIEEWYRILRPGGVVVTSNRISPEYGTDKIIANEGQVNDFVRRAARHIDENQSWLRPQINTISKLADEYARNIYCYSIPSEAYLCQLFEKFDCKVESGFTTGELSGPEKYAWIMAVKK